MSNTFLPFNFAPKAHVILSTGGTTSYTILANEFALITISSVIASSAASLTVDAVSVYESDYYTSSTQTSAINTINTYTNGTAFEQVMTAINDVTLASVLPAAVTEMVILPGQTWIAAAIPGQTSTIRTYSRIRGSSASASHIWVKAGNAIAISGGNIKAVIHRYDLPS